MKRISKIISVVVLTFVFCLTLAGCSVYHDYKDNLPYHNVYEKIKLDKLVKVLDEEKNNDTKDEVTYVVYASNKETASTTAITVLNEQAKQYGIDKIYYLDCAKYYKKSSGRKNVQDKLGMKDASVCPTILVYIDGQLKVDWSKTSIKDKYDSNYTKLCYEIFANVDKLK